MESWSRYNHILNSKKIGRFIYNSRTNSFTKINDTLFDKLNHKEIDLTLLDQKTLITFRELKIVVNENEDDNYYYNKKFQRYLYAYTEQFLSLTIATTTKCNFRCPYCYENIEKKTTLNKDIDNAIIKFINKNNAKNVSIIWYGGEPLMNFKSIKHIMSALKNEYEGKTIDYSMVTNGSLLTKKIVDFLKTYNVSSIQITLDGLKETNDKTRIFANGKGSFDIITKNIDYAVKEMPTCMFSIRVNTNKKNIDEYPLLYNYITNRYKYNNIAVYHAYITDYSNKLKWCINKRDGISYNSLLAEKHGIIDFELYPKFRLGGCTANTINSLVIDPEGRICKCWLEIGKEDRIVGNIMSENNLNQSLLSKYMTNSDMFNNQKCKKCYLFPVCDGGCPYQRLENGHKAACPLTKNGIDTYLEIYYKKLIQKQKNNENE